MKDFYAPRKKTSATAANVATAADDEQADANEEEEEEVEQSDQEDDDNEDEMQEDEDSGGNDDEDDELTSTISKKKWVRRNNEKKEASLPSVRTAADFEKMIRAQFKAQGQAVQKHLRDALDCEKRRSSKGNVTNSRSTAISDSTPQALAEVLEEAAVASSALVFPSMPLILAMIYASARIARLPLLCSDLIRAVKDDVIPYFTAHASILPDDLRQRLRDPLKSKGSPLLFFRPFNVPTISTITMISENLMCMLQQLEPHDIARRLEGISINENEIDDDKEMVIDDNDENNRRRGKHENGSSFFFGRVHGT